MSDREIQVPEVEGMTIQSMRLTLTSSAETEIQIDFTDGTSFTSSTCPRRRVRRGTIYRRQWRAPNHQEIRRPIALNKRSKRRAYNDAE